MASVPTNSRKLGTGMPITMTRTTAPLPGIVVCTALLLTNVALTSRSEVIDLIAGADTTLQAFAPHSNYGGDDSIRVGGRLQGGAARGLIRFDLTGRIPAGASINSVTLTVEVLGTMDAAVDSTFAVHRVLQDWGEGVRVGEAAQVGEASWNSRLGPATPWTVSGGDFAAEAGAVQNIAGNGVYRFTSALLVQDVQSWLTNAAENFGWVLRSESEAVPTTIRRFGSRTTAGSEPKLTIDYSAVPPLEISNSAVRSGEMRFSFKVVGGQTYSVEFRGSLADGDWSVLTNPVAPTGGVSVDFTNAISLPSGFYRVRSPSAGLSESP